MERTVNGFFYGLFMDPEVLQEKGIVAFDPRRAHVQGYALKIGERATLIPEPESKAFGMVMALSHADLAASNCV